MTAPGRLVGAGRITLHSAPRARRGSGSRGQGQAADYVREEDCPTRVDVFALANALQY